MRYPGRFHAEERERHRERERGEREGGGGGLRPCSCVTRTVGTRLAALIQEDEQQSVAMIGPRFARRVLCQAGRVFSHTRLPEVVPMGQLHLRTPSLNLVYIHSPSSPLHLPCLTLARTLSKSQRSLHTHKVCFVL